VEFAAYRIPKSRISLPKACAGWCMVPELREVRVQVSFSRFDSVSANLQGEYDFDSAKLKPAPLTCPGGNQKWLPAAEVRGEGIFVELDEAAVAHGRSDRRSVAAADKLLKAFDVVRAASSPGHPLLPASQPLATCCSRPSAWSVGTRPARSASASTASPRACPVTARWPR
jgi:hypothetical protein